MSWNFVKGGVRALALLPLCALMPAEPPAESGAATLALFATDGPAALSKGYGLGVVPMPPPPAVGPLTAADGPAGCPIEVRAIVVAEPASDSFAVLAWGDESAVMQRGDSRRTPHGWLRVHSIRSDRVELRRGDVTFHCALGGDAGAHSSGR